MNNPHTKAFRLGSNLFHEKEYLIELSSKTLRLKRRGIKPLSN